jgi:hypothetical protein
MKRFNKNYEKGKRREAYHPSAFKGGTRGSGSFAVILSQ